MQSTMGTTASSSGRLEIQSVVDQVYAAVRARILSGELPAAAGCGRPDWPRSWACREPRCGRRCAGWPPRAWWSSAANRGATVAEHDFGDQRQSWLARMALEPGAARIAAERRDAGSVAAMREAIGAQRAAGGDPAESYDVNRGFHLALVAASGNPYLLRFAEMLWAPQLGVLIYAMQADDPAHVLAWADDHERITDAVEAGDPELAERLTREHIQAFPPVER